jgi:hypothetical protein
MPNFIPGLELCGRYYAELVRPMLDGHFPNLRYAAALIGYGSEVLGFDTEMSMDHAWSPRLILFLRENDLALAGQIDELLKRELPTHFLGFPLGTRPSADEPGVFFMDEMSRVGQVEHKTLLTGLRDYVLETMNWDLRQPLEPVDWLTIPSQVLCVMTAGRVYFDNLGELTKLRQQLAWYPHDLWLYLMASVWDRIGQEEHLMPRAGFVGDELGSALIGSRLVRDVMSLCYLMEKQYAPYPKWFGTAFQRLTCATAIAPLLWQAQQAPTWPERQKALGAAFELLARQHNALGFTNPLPEKVSSFHGRPFLVIHAEVFAEALKAKINDSEILRIAEKGLLGGLDQFSDSTVLRSDLRWRPSLKALYK